MAWLGLGWKYFHGTCANRNTQCVLVVVNFWKLPSSKSRTQLSIHTHIFQVHCIVIQKSCISFGEGVSNTHVSVHAKSLQSCSTLWDPVDCSLSGSSVRGMEWVAMPSSRGSSWPRDRTHISYVFCTLCCSFLTVITLAHCINRSFGH